MDKRETTILIWILSLASVLVMILYSPIGSPDMYSKPQTFASMNGVLFAGRIENSSGFGNSARQNHPELIIDSYRIADPTVQSPNASNNEVSVEVADPTKKDIPTYKQENKKHLSYKVSRSYKSISEQNTTYSVVNSNSKDGEYSSAGGSSAGIAGNTPVYGSSGRNSKDNNNVGNNNFTTLNLDLSLFSDSTNNNRAVDYAESQGGTDPGGNPKTDPIPISNGTSFLIVMSCIYVLCKNAYVRNRCNIFRKKMV